MLVRTIFVGLICLGLTLTACDDGETGTDAGPTSDTVADTTGTPDVVADTGADAATEVATPAVGSFNGGIQTILADKCTPCHTGGTAGGHNIGTTHADALIAATPASCTGLTVGACAILRIKNGSMPAGKGCSGDPTTDAGNSACLTKDEQDAVQAWVDLGMPEN